MKEWLTASEIAAARLPDFPSTTRGVALRADAERWASIPSLARHRDGQGGGIEYHIRLLPTQAQIAYMQRHMVVAANDEPAQSAEPEAPAPMSAKARDELDARLAIIAAFELFSRGSRLRQASRLQIFCDKYEMGSLQVEDWVKTLIPRVSKRSLLRWMAARKAGETSTMAVDRAKCRKGTGVFDLAENGRLKAFVLALVIEQPHFSAKHIRTLCLDEFGATVEVCGNPTEMPPVRTFQWALKGLKEANQVLITKITNPDDYRRKLRASGTGMLRHIDQPNELWMIDASPVDALCVDGRHQIYIAIDVATRRIVITVSRTPRASAVALMIRKAGMTWGIPKQIKTDNGSDFVAEATKRLFRSLDIEPILSAKYTPTEKGHVERVIGTFQRTVGPLLPGFIGHDVADRKAIEERRSFAARLGTTDAAAFGVQLTAAELQDKIDQWVSLDYHQKKHSAIGRSPFAAAAASTARPRMIHERAWDVLLMPVAGKDGQRTVTARGIRIDGYYYGIGEVLPRTQVLVRMEPDDMGTVYAFTPDGAQFLGIARCPELAGIQPGAFWSAVREAHADILRQGGKWMEAERRRIAKGPTFIDRYLRQKQREYGNVIALPKRAEEHSTPQVAAAIAALAPRVDAGLDARAEAEQRRLIAEMDAASDADIIAQGDAAVAARQAEIEAARTAHLPQGITALPESPKAKYRRALEIIARIEAGTADARDAFWVGRYQETAEFRGQAQMHAAFGDDYLAL